MKTIQLSKGKVAFIDDADYPEVSKHKWFSTQAREGAPIYAAINAKNENGNFRLLSMHRFLMHPDEEMVVDHINGNGLDNRRENLRIVTKRENAQHKPGFKKSSKFLGVTWHKRDKKWQATITIYIGSFSDEKQAHDAYASTYKKLEDLGLLTRVGKQNAEN